MNREQVFLAVLSGVVARGPQFKRREAGQCGPLEVDYDKMIKITNNVTDAVMNHVGPKQQMERSMTKESNTEDILRDMVEVQKDRIKELEQEIGKENYEAQIDELNRVIHSYESGNEVARLRDRVREQGSELAKLHLRDRDHRNDMEAMKRTACDHRVSAIKLSDETIRLRAEVDRLKEQANADLENDRDLAAKLNRELRELSESRTNFNEACKTVEAKEFKILELEDEIKRLERELQSSNQALAAAGTRPTWHHLREVEKELQNAKLGLKAVADVVLERDATIDKMQADKDALRKAVEDGAMEIERLTNTLKGVEQIARMKPEDVEMLAKYAQEGCGWVPNMLDNDKPRLFREPAEIKLVGDPDIRDGKVYSVGIVSEEIWPMNVPGVLPVDIKNDLSSAVANSTEGQRVVVEDLEATVEVRVDSDRIDQQVEIGDQVKCLHTIQNIIGEQWYKVTDIKLQGEGPGLLFKIEGDKSNWYHPYYFGLTDAIGITQMPGAEARWRKPKHEDAPVSSVAAAEDPEEWVVITDLDHVLRPSDEVTATSNFNCIENCLQKDRGDGGGWLSCNELGHAGRKAGLSMDPGGMTYRCKRKDLPVTPPAAESQT